MPATPRTSTFAACVADQPAAKVPNAESVMRRFVSLLCAVAVVGCARTEDAADTSAAATATPAQPAPISLSDVAGTWAVRGMNQAGDSTLVTYELKATADTTGWTITFPNRPPVPVRVVSVAGDSIVIDAGPYESALRRGVRVTTHGSFRLQDGKIVGTTRARYDTKGADSVLIVRSEGTRKP